MDEYTDINFKEHFSSIAKTCSSYKMTGRFEVTAYYDDGHVAICNLRNKYSYYIPPKPDRPETEQEFRDRISRVIQDRLRWTPCGDEKFAELLGISRMQLWRILNGQSTPSSYLLVKMANLLGCPVSEIMDHD